MMVITSWRPTRPTLCMTWRKCRARSEHTPTTDSVSVKNIDLAGSKRVDSMAGGDDDVAKDIKDE